MTSVTGTFDLQVLLHVVLALALGLLVGLERHRAGKGVAMRTFALAGLSGLLGWMVAPVAAYIVLVVLALYMVVMSVQGVSTGEPMHITTSVALLITGLAGVLIGQGQTFVAIASVILMTAVLAWRDELVGIAAGLTQSEVRSALNLGIIGLVVFPALPVGYIDPWSIVNVRDLWLIVLLIAGIGSVNYILLRIYGARGVIYTGLLGGLVNSTVTVAELGQRARGADGEMAQLAIRGAMLATGAMLVRNAVVMGILAPAALIPAALPLGAMAVAALAPAAFRLSTAPTANVKLESPFSVRQVLRFAIVLLAITVVGSLALRGLGDLGFYVVSFIGGTVSSASTAATAGAFASQSRVTADAAAIGVLLSSIASAIVHVPIFWRAIGDAGTGRRLLLATSATVLVGILAVVASQAFGLSRVASLAAGS
jgi:uncharacterized membrane protein (DUF4010 family)